MREEPRAERGRGRLLFRICRAGSGRIEAHQQVPPRLTGHGTGEIIQIGVTQVGNLECVELSVECLDTYSYLLVP